MANDIIKTDAGLSPIVETAAGRLRGSFIDGVHSFKGVPYGAPTGGPNRFRPPVPPDARGSLRDGAGTPYGLRRRPAPPRPTQGGATRPIS
jgi:para-nitrobenzyl esterase